MARRGLVEARWENPKINRSGVPSLVEEEDATVAECFAKYPEAGPLAEQGAVESFDQRPFASNTARRGLVDWLHTYNFHRGHTALGGHPPIRDCYVTDPLCGKLSLDLHPA